MSFKIVVAAILAVISLAGCAGGHVGIAPNGRAYAQMSIPPMQGYGYAPQQRPVIVVPQQSYRQPYFRSEHHSHRYGGSQSSTLVQQCKVNTVTGQRICQMMPSYMVNRW